MKKEAYKMIITMVLSYSLLSIKLNVKTAIYENKSRS